MSDLVASLMEILPHINSSRERVDVLNQLAWELRRSNLSQSEQYHAEALRLTQELGYSSGLAYAKINEGFYLYSSYGRIGEAILAFNEAVEILEDQKDCKGLGTAFSFLGYLYWSGAAYEKAFQLVNIALGHHQEVEDAEGIGWDLHTLGGFHQELGDTEKAQKMFEEALQAFKSIANGFGMATALNGLASLSLAEGKHEVAFKLLEESLVLSETEGLGDSKAGTLMLEGDVFWDQKDYAQACSYHLKGLMQYQENGDVLGSLTAQMKLASFYFHTEDYPEALKYLEKVKKDAPENGAQNTLLEALKLSAQVHEAQQNFRAALSDTQAYSALAEQTMGDQRRSQAERMQAVAAAAQAEQETEIHRLRNVELKDAYDQIEKQQESIVSSIRYASRIQKSILPSPKFLEEHFTESFLFFQPRDIVSGDFYWFAEVEGKWIVGAIDCTGHGVPGAFMVVLGNTLLADIVLDEKVTDPGEIIRQMDKRVVKSLQGSGEGQANDGMDVAMMVYNPKERVLEFAGAKNPLLRIRDGEMERIKGSTSAVGGQRLGKNPKSFQTHRIEVACGDRFYIYSDGFQDQFGGPNQTKYLSKRFRNWLFEHSHLPMAEQNRRLEQEFNAWKGEGRQTDDIIVIGLRVD